jgi:inosine-uridine nucleoside N-ribohydrolase
VAVKLEPTAVILDCDPGHDDAIALLLALASPELDLVGVTTVAGNQTLEKTTANALRVLEFVGRGEVPVAAGASRPLVRQPSVAAHVHGESGLDGPSLPQARGLPLATHAVDFMAETIRARGGAVTLVPTGPLTNVALLLALAPDARPERIVLMGGAAGEGNRTPAAEFNIWCDPEAARRVFESGLDVTMVGLEVTHQALLRDADGERLRAAGRVGVLAAELLDFYGRFHRRAYPELDGSPMHDPVAVAHVIWPGLLETAAARVEIDCGWEQGRGRTNVDRRGREGAGAPNATIGVGIDAPRFVSSLIERLASLG